ncbi:C40 family peptidase [Aldersonia sp. NBC_00410]|uniref:C40 family peptidase n=1 Tax=Aldersonia sp. NBC_00410 TaxID=2975954 RepID=UPI00224D87EB|nr:C40 family peptidase [Aldersonia sp. NBC_00410]MCX5045947.1 C40 family peptidase [Aldersonia sp. NBC_00410]
MATLESKRSVRRAAVTGALVLGAIVAPAAPALAAPVSVPGVGTFDIPEIPGVALPPLPGAPAAPAPAPAPQLTAGDRALQAAESKIGAPYVYGAAGPNSFDCSGLVQWAYSQAGVNVPRTSEAQLGAGTPVAISDLRPGDLVSFYGGGHSGLYAGNGNVVHASTSGQPVKVAALSSMPVSGARRY